MYFLVSPNLSKYFIFISPLEGISFLHTDNMVRVSYLMYVIYYIVETIKSTSVRKRQRL
jgi:hypothetical protein